MGGFIDPAPREQSSGGAELPRASRLGLALFALYLAAYVGFVLLNAYAPSVMESNALGGVNLAVVYGMLLISGALALSLLYAALTRGGDA